VIHSLAMEDNSKSTVSNAAASGEESSEDAATNPPTHNKSSVTLIAEFNDDSRPPDSPTSRHKGGNAKHTWGRQALQVAGSQPMIDMKRFNRRQRRERISKACGAVAENKYFSTFSVMLTLWALLADDVRRGFTPATADMFFNGMTLMCLVFFSLEVLISSIGKPDYFLGFFFCLDLIATMSLLLDLTWVADAMSDSSGPGGKEARGGRTARIGASVGRMVRVLRLVRIVKLYKAYFDRLQASAKAGQKQKEQDDAAEPGDDSAFWDEDPDEDKGEDVRESLVGQKLTSLTIRKVIIMVLVMLMVLPQLSVDKLEKTPRSPSWGADSVDKAFQKMMSNAKLSERRLSNSMYQGLYQQELLRYIYYHNWFDQDDSDSGAGAFTSHLFWFGLAGKSESEVQLAALQAPPASEVISSWEHNVTTKDYYYTLSELPTSVANRLSQPWDTKCRWKTDWGDMVLLGRSFLSERIDDLVDYTIDCPYQQDELPNYLRKQEVTPYWPLLIPESSLIDVHFVAFFDLRPYQRSSATLSMLTTSFICFVLCVGSLVFSRDANELVLNPLEQMMHKVNTIRDNPLIAMKMADQEYQNEERARLKRQESRGQNMGRFGSFARRAKNIVCCVGQGREKKKQDVMETAILEKTIIKLGSLLALGFGEAGVSIVSSNMSSTMAGVNAMTPGTRVDCFIGTAKVIEFSSVTQVLQGKVLTFVNQVAEIVHGVVDQYHGAANKNNGDTFLLIWRTRQKKYKTECTEEQSLQKLADMSVFAFVTILSAVERSRVLARYRGHPGLQQRLGADCRVALTFGLHFGWAIEGAVGSEFKIDASYLSPTVSVAESCERATKVYGVSMIISKAVISHCSKSLTYECRLIDHVEIKGSKEPIELYTVDLDLHALEVEEKAILKGGWNVKQRFKARQLLEVERKRKLGLDYEVASVFSSDETVQPMRQIYTTEFLQIFNMGYRNYAEGEWEVARQMLARTLSMLAPRDNDGSGRRRSHHRIVEDGPSRALLSFMAKHDFQAPFGWQGIRELEDDHAV